ncbi:MAG: alanine racemase [bacterium]|nr:alanine racemase [bacterium]
MYRNTYVEINTNTLSNNIKQIKQRYNNYQYYIGVVKANAYGHGIYIVNDLIKSGINYLAVSSLEEALAIRTYNKTIPILVLEPVSANNVDIVSASNITLTIDSYNHYQELKQSKKPLTIHIKLNTGMNRLGIKTKDELDKILSNKDKNITIEGIYTHLATTGINDYYYDLQIKNFNDFIKDIDISKIPIIHVGRSVTLVNHEKLPSVNGIRLGIIMYGFNQSISIGSGIMASIRKLKRQYRLKKYKISPSTLSNDLTLKTAFAFYTEVISITKVKKGEFVGYGATYIAKEDITVGILPCGYADGIDKNMKEVVINNKRYPIIGDICMDMTIIKIDNDVILHDKVEIFGNVISIREVSNKLNINAYRLFTSITTRVPRVYNNNSEINKEIKY